MSLVSFSTTPGLTGNWQHQHLATLTGLQTDLMDVQMIRFYQLCYAPHARQQCEVHIHGHNLLQSNLRSCSMGMAERSAERCGKVWDTWKTLYVVLRI